MTLPLHPLRLNVSTTKIGYKRVAHRLPVRSLLSAEEDGHGGSAHRGYSSFGYL
jgi:hypothetical protein